MTQRTTWFGPESGGMTLAEIKAHAEARERAADELKPLEPPSIVETD